MRFWMLVVLATLALFIACDNVVDSAKTTPAPTAPPAAAPTPSGTVGQVPQITSSSGWLESASIEWHPLTAATSYNVSSQKSGATTWTKLDAPLIRSYGTYLRADALGLSAGSYTLKVVGVDAAGAEFTESATATVAVLAHDRSGFAFLGTTTPGAYNAEGTLKSNANVVYVTNANRNSVSLTVAGATTNPAVGLQSILDGYKKGTETKPLAVRLIGNITDLPYLLGGDVVIGNNKSPNGITLEGVGKDAVALDTKKSNFVTLSYNHFWDSGKSNLLGLSAGVKSYDPNAYDITYHDNWYDHSDSRHPRTRYYNAHVYNNYFRNTKSPMMTSMQGTDVYSTGTVRSPGTLGTFSGEAGGVIKAVGNVMTGTYTFIPYGAA